MVLTTPKMTATTPAAVEASGLSKTYGATRAVRGLSLRVEAAGQVFGFLGPQRGGKDDHDPDAARPPAAHGQSDQVQA
jgi:hypothetical protein